MAAALRTAACWFLQLHVLGRDGKSQFFWKRGKENGREKSSPVQMSSGGDLSTLAIPPRSTTDACMMNSI